MMAKGARARAGRDVLRPEDVQELAALARLSTGRAASRKAGLLRRFAGWSIDNGRVLLAYHDCLLFLLAYPETPELRAMAERELGRVATEARRLGERSRDRRR